MAQIDVSDLLLDPDFVDTVWLVHRSVVINSQGENVITDAAPVVTVGSVQPASNKQLQRLPEALRSSDVRAFYIKARILNDGSTTYPDIIVFNSRRFQVQSIEDWQNFGQGWSMGTCVAEVISE